MAKAVLVLLLVLLCVAASSAASLSLPGLSGRISTDDTTTVMVADNDERPFLLQLFTGEACEDKSLVQVKVSAPHHDCDEAAITITDQQGNDYYLDSQDVDYDEQTGRVSWNYFPRGVFDCADEPQFIVPVIPTYNCLQLNYELLIGKNQVKSVQLEYHQQ